HRRLHGVLVLTDLAVGGALDIADEALAAFHFQSHTAKTVRGNDGLLGLLSRLGMLRLGAWGVEAGQRRLGGVGLAGGRRWARRIVVHPDVDGRNGDVRVNDGV